MLEWYYWRKLRPYHKLIPKDIDKAIADLKKDIEIDDGIIWEIYRRLRSMDNDLELILYMLNNDCKYWRNSYLKSIIDSAYAELYEL